MLLCRIKNGNNMGLQVKVNFLMIGIREKVKTKQQVLKINE